MVRDQVINNLIP